MGRIEIVISIPDDFTDRFLAFVNNINAVNLDRGTSEVPIKIEKMYDQPKPDVAAVPKENKQEGDDIEG